MQPTLLTPYCKPFEAKSEGAKETTQIGNLGEEAVDSDECDAAEPRKGDE